MGPRKWLLLGSGRREGPTCEVGRGCQWAPPSFPRIPGRGPGWGPAFADACLSSLSSLPTLSPVSLSSFYLSLDYLWVPSYPSVSSLLPGPSPSTPGFDPFASWGISLCTSPNWHSVPFSCPYVSLWVTSVFISGPGLPFGLTPLLIPVCLCLSSRVLASGPPFPHSSLYWVLATLSHSPIISALCLPI